MNAIYDLQKPLRTKKMSLYTKNHQTNHNYNPQTRSIIVSSKLEKKKG